ncbi:MAG: MFS transporter [Oscillospiraceae bacterium]|jgi:sugar (glycoside-pentoside-hexuronide) transporter|nr:MFS transporter [Oscillospiraceae bacterium]
MQQQGKLKTCAPLERNMYMTGLFGQNIIFNILSAFANYYMQSVLLIPSAIIGVILVIAQVWDAFNDPMMGTIVDKTRSKWGKCRPYLLFVPIINGVITVLCFVGIGRNYDVSQGFTGMNVAVVVFAAFIYIVWGMTYTAGDIPLWGISALMTEDEKDRRKLQAAARIAAGIGSGVAVLAFQPVALSVGGVLRTTLNMGSAQAEKLGFILVATAFTILGAGTFQLAGVFAREKIKPSDKTNSLGENFKMIWNNKPFRKVLLSGTLAGPRNLTMIVALSMVTFYFSGKDGAVAMMYLALIGGGLFIGMFGATALTPKLLEKHSKKTLYNMSNLVEILPDLAIFGLYLISVAINKPAGLTAIYLLVPTILLFFIKGACLGLYSAVQTTMIADCVDYEDYTNHLRPDGVFFSGQTFMVKIGNGISSLLYAGLCAFVGFSDVNIDLFNKFIAAGGVPREAMTIGAETLRAGAETFALTGGQVRGFFTMMFFAVSVLPAIGSVLALIPTRNYELTPEKLEEILGELQQRRRVAGETEE